MRQASDVGPIADDGWRRVGGFADPGGAEELERVAQPEDLHATVRVDQVDATVGQELEGTLGPVRLSYIGREALMRNKEAAARAKDLADLEALRSASGRRGARKSR